MRLSFLILLALGAAIPGQGCIDPYQTDRVTAVEPCGSYIFSLTSKKPIREIDVIELSDMGRMVDVLWRIRTEQGSDHRRYVCYGVVPRGYRQLIPRSGSPERLGPSNYVVRTRSHPIDEDASHYYQLGPVGEELWRVDSRRTLAFGEAEFGFRIDSDGRVVTPTPGR